MNNQNSPFIYVGPFIHSLSLTRLEYVTDGVIVVSNGKIVFVERRVNDLATVQKKFNVTDENVYKLIKGQFLIPGFIDTHIHASQYPNVGLGYDLPLLEWLETYTFPLEAKFGDEHFAEKVYNAVVRKTIANGTTTACYFATIHTNGSLILAKCVKNIGQRAFVGKVNMNKNTPRNYGETLETSLADTRAFIEGVKSLKSELVKPIITPRFAVSCDMNLMKALGQLADEYKLPVQTHVSENVSEVELVKKEFPDCKNYVDVYDKAGLISSKTILAHGIHLDADEMDVIKKSKATISHCAISNLLLDSGVCPVRQFLNEGLKVSLGTDCSGGSTCSILETIRQTLNLSIQVSFNRMYSKLSLEEVFYMATLGGAEALQLENTIGNFSVGKDFDAILIDLNNKNALDLLEEYNLQQLFQKFIYLGDDRVMSKVYVAGKIIKQ